MNRSLFFVCSIILLLTIDARNSRAQSFELIDLGNHFPTNSYAAAVNRAGQVVGYWDSQTNGVHAFLYTDGTIVDLGTLGGTNAYALSINSVSTVAGFRSVAGINKAFLYDGAIRDLPYFGDRNSYALGINTAGNIVGFFETTNGMRAFHYDGLALLNLGTLGGTNSYAFALNEASHVAGGSLLADNAQANAFLWQSGLLINLNDLIAREHRDKSCARSGAERAEHDQFL